MSLRRSRAAVAGGVTTFFEQPNTVPQTVTIPLLEEKFAIAKQSSYANYSFFLGGTNESIFPVDEPKKSFTPAQAFLSKRFSSSRLSFVPPKKKE